MTEGLFDEKIRDTLASTFLDYLKTATFSSQDLTHKIQTFVSTLSANGRKITESYLTRQGDLELAQAFYDSQDRDIQNVLALAGEEISNLLKHTLARFCNEKYGIDPEDPSPLAIPFLAANQPHSGSQFASGSVTANYTLQYYLKVGISRKAIKKVVKDLQGKATKQRNEENIPVKKTAAWKTFKMLCGDLDIPSFNLKKAHYIALTNHVNQSFERKRDFTVQGILPLIESFEGSISCNSHNLVSFFNKAGGITGTLSNSDSMHGMLTANPDIGIDARMLSKIWEKSYNQVHLLPEGSAEEMYRHMNKIVSCDMIADGGGYFKVKEGSDLPIARMMATASGGKPVVFYDAKGEVTITDGTKETPLDQSSVREDQRSVFLAQRFTRGADVLLKRNAVAGITIGPDMTLSKFLQTCGRMRGLFDKGQRPVFFLSVEVDAIIRQMLHKPATEVLQLNDILQFVIRNQSERQGRDNMSPYNRSLQISLSRCFSKPLHLIFPSKRLVL